MVSWDIKVKFSGLTPHIRELDKLASMQDFRNIEEMHRIEICDNGNSVWMLIVNDRGLRQPLKSMLIDVIEKEDLLILKEKRRHMI